MLIHRAKKQDKEVVTSILAKSFKQYEHLNWILRDCKNPDKLKLLMEYVFEEAMRIGEVYYNNEETAAAILNTGLKEKFRLRFIRRDIGIIKKIGIRSVIRIIVMMSKTHKHYPKNSPYYCFYMLGVGPEAQGKGHSSKLMNPILNKIECLKQPAVLETSSSVNVEIYKKKGFTFLAKESHGSYDVFIMQKN